MSPSPPPAAAPPSDNPPRHVVPPVPPRDCTRGITAEVWIEVPTQHSGTSATLLAQWSETNAAAPVGVFHLLARTAGPDAGPAFFVITDAGPAVARAESPLPPGRHHLAGTHDGQFVRLFVNAEPVAATRHSGRLATSSLPVTVGCLAPGRSEFSGRVLHAALFSAALTPCQIASKHLWHRIAEECDRLPEIELESSFILDGRKYVRGRVRLPEPISPSVEICVRHTASGEIRWSQSLAPPPPNQPADFTIPLHGFPGGYYRVEIRDAHGNTAAANFALREDAKIRPGNSVPDYASWLRGAVDRILTSQTKHAGGTDAVAAVTTDLPAHLGYRSLAYRMGNTFHTGTVSAKSLDYDTFRLDHEIWPILDGLSELTGDPRYAELACAMVRTVADWGFDPRSGLLRFGEETDLDVRRRDVCSKMSPRHVPTFKPINTGPRPDMHLDRFWRHLPAQTHRWLRATYYGHVTNPDSMDFNRVSFYGFDDSLRVPALAPDNAFCGFETCAASLIGFWASCWVHAGDEECLGWARSMTAKWRAVQHPESGLLPNFFGAGPPDSKPAQDPGQWTDSPSAALAAEQFLRAAACLRLRSGAESLAEDLTDMGTKLAVGTALNSYDATTRRFRPNLLLDGRPYATTARYCFRTQDEKDTAVKINPLMTEVPVFDGSGFYSPPNFHELCAGNNIPYNLSAAAWFCRDPRLVECLRRMAADAVDDALNIQGAFTPEARWTFRATGWYVEMCLRLFEITGETLHLNQARQLADREIAALETARHPDWWRMRERTVWLDALLHLSRVKSTHI